MYLYLGSSTVVPHQEIIGVFNLDNVSASPRTREFLRRAEEKGALTTLGPRLPATLVVTTRGSYLSPTSPQTLVKRLAEDVWE